MSSWGEPPNPRSFVLIVPLWNWNEESRFGITVGLKVLIVPLWNWNKFCRYMLRLEVPVLIVPLWNWNEFMGGAPKPPFFCSNRTFMELKWRITLWDNRRFKSSNRTFMELKYMNSRIITWSSPVLIVPLWNWNHVIAVPGEAAFMF